MGTDWKLRTVDAELERRWRDEGLWNDETLGELLARGLGRQPDVEFVVHSETRPWSGTFGGVYDLAARVASGLRARGVGPGDPVAFQLPNWIEAAAVFYAASFLGAVVVPIVHFYGPKELDYILRRTGVKAFVSVSRFGPTDYLERLAAMDDTLAGIDIIAAVDPHQSLPAPMLDFADLVVDQPIDGPVPVDAGEPALLAYTSGTTADPKGVIHSHRTIGCEVRQLAALQPAGAPPHLVGAPVGHAIGMLGALLTPVVNGRPIHLTDVWDPPRLLAIMSEHRLACGSGATFFLTSLLDHPDCTDDHLELMHYAGMGGAAVPAAVSDRATKAGLSIVRMYGSTEHPSITGGTHDDPLDKRIHTDGTPLEGVEIRLVDDDDRPVSPGEPGEILSRGPDCFMGYIDPDLTANAFDAGGWFRTGDVGVVDADGYLTITDRKKDIIIRGGENVSAAEVEEVVARMPAVAEVAVVSGPDERLGERVCAFVRAARGANAPTLADIRSAMIDAGLARQKWPEDLRVVDALPRTPSGKVQKAQLRRVLRDEHWPAGRRG